MKHARTTDNKEYFDMKNRVVIDGLVIDRYKTESGNTVASTDDADLDNMERNLKALHSAGHKPFWVYPEDKD